MKAFELLEEYLVEHYPTRAERLADWWVHAVGLAAAVAGGLALLVYCIFIGGPGLIAATSLYALCLVAMLSASGPPRKYYRLTGAGHASFAAQKAEWAAFAKAVDDILGGGS